MARASQGYPRYYSYGAEPRHYGAPGEIEGRYTARAAETVSLGSLGKLDVYGYAGGQDLGQASNFGGQNKGIQGMGAVMLSNNEKALVAVAVIGIAGWFFFGSKIKKGFKKNPAKKKWSASARANMRKGLTPAGNRRTKNTKFEREVRAMMRKHGIGRKEAAYWVAQAAHQ